MLHVLEFRHIAALAARNGHLSPTRKARHKPTARKCVCRRHAKRLFVLVALDCGDGSGERFEAIADGGK
jgi:hypothetical protein